MKKLIWLFTVIFLLSAGCSATKTCPTNFHASSYVTYKNDATPKFSSFNKKGTSTKKYKADRWKPVWSKWNRKGSRNRLWN